MANDLAAADAATTPPLPLAPLHLPAEPSAWPLAWGWWLIILITLGALIACGLGLYRYQIKRRAKQQALNKLAQCQSVSEAHNILRQAAMSYFPRQQVAALTGQAWYQFLDGQLSQSQFAPQQARWEQALYRENSADRELIEQAKGWVKKALPPKNINGGRHA